MRSLRNWTPEFTNPLVPTSLNSRRRMKLVYRRVVQRYMFSANGCTSEPPAMAQSAMQNVPTVSPSHPTKVLPSKMNVPPKPSAESTVRARKNCCCSAEEIGCVKLTRPELLLFVATGVHWPKSPDHSIA